MAYLDDLRAAIKRLHGCDAKHVESVPVLERFEGATVWEGTVEVFDLMGHEKAMQCFAWSHETDEGGTRYVAVLRIAPVDAPRQAVRAAILSESSERPIAEEN